MTDHYSNMTEILRAFDRAQDKNFTLAGEMMKVAGTFKDLETFAVAMKAAEEDRRSKIRERIIAKGATKEEAAIALKLNPAYSQAKSNIVSMWKLGRSPADFKSYSELTIELNKARKTAKGGAEKSPTQAAGEEVKALHSVVKGMTHARRIENVVLSLLALSDGNQAEVLDEFELILKDYEPEKREEVKTEEVTAKGAERGGRGRSIKRKKSGGTGRKEGAGKKRREEEETEEVTAKAAGEVPVLEAGDFDTSVESLEEAQVALANSSH